MSTSQPSSVPLLSLFEAIYRYVMDKKWKL